MRASSTGLRHKKEATEGVRSVRSSSMDALRTSLGKEMSHPVSQPRLPAFILGIVPPHFSSVCHPFPWKHMCGLEMAPAGLAEDSCPGAELQRCLIHGYHTISSHPRGSLCSTGVSGISLSKMRELNHREFGNLVKGSQQGRSWGEIQVQVWCQRLYSPTWQDRTTLTSVYPT